MRTAYWLLCIVSMIGVYYSGVLHEFLHSNVSFYKFANDQVIQVLLAILAGVFATKGSDPSRELKELLRIRDIEKLLSKADEAQSKSIMERQRLGNIVQLVSYEVEQQFAREMLITHRQQLTHHWEQIQKLEGILEKEESNSQIDPDVREIIQRYIVRTQYIEYMGKGFLRNIPVFGRLLDYLLGPIWNAYYLKNMHKLNKLMGRKKPNDETKRAVEEIKAE